MFGGQGASAVSETLTPLTERTQPDRSAVFDEEGAGIDLCAIMEEVLPAQVLSCNLADTAFGNELDWMSSNNYASPAVQVPETLSSSSLEPYSSSSPHAQPGISMEDGTDMVTDKDDTNTMLSLLVDPVQHLDAKRELFSSSAGVPAGRPCCVCEGVEEMAVCSRTRKHGLRTSTDHNMERVAHIDELLAHGILADRPGELQKKSLDELRNMCRDHRLKPKYVKKHLQTARTLFHRNDHRRDPKGRPICNYIPLITINNPLRVLCDHYCKHVMKALNRLVQFVQLDIGYEFEKKVVEHMSHEHALRVLLQGTKLSGEWFAAHMSQNMPTAVVALAAGAHVPADTSKKNHLRITDRDEALGRLQVRESVMKFFSTKF